MGVIGSERGAWEELVVAPVVWTYRAASMQVERVEERGGIKPPQTLSELTSFALRYNATVMVVSEEDEKAL